MRNGEITYYCPCIGALKIYRQFEHIKYKMLTVGIDVFGTITTLLERCKLEQVII